MTRTSRMTTLKEHHSKFGRILLILTVFVLIVMLYVSGNLEFQKKFSPPTIKPRLSINQSSNQSFCVFRPLSPEEAREEKLLLDSIAWPETPPLQPSWSLKDSSDPAHSTFIILPKRGGAKWLIGDQLEALIKMRDFRGRPKKFGGDFLLARLHNPTVGAGVAGRVVDHFNGSYSAIFSLLWEGNAKVQVKLVHPVEAVHFLQEFNSKKPNGVYFSSLFRSGSVTEKTSCNVCLPPTSQSLCDYTDLRTGEPWFCYKPKNLSCESRIIHFCQRQKHTKDKKDKFFKKGVNMKVSIPSSGPGHITVFANKKGQQVVKSSSVKSEPSGYYYQGEWRSLGNTAVQQFNTPSAISECLKGKMVHMYGDSTVRQWFEYLIKALPDLKVFNLFKMMQSGPYMAVDYANNTMVMHRSHGIPIRIRPTPITELHYIANELDDVTGGENTVVVFGIWAHFTTFPIEVYIRRLMSIRKAVVRLLVRAPDTVVIIRSANLKKVSTPSYALTGSDWFSLQRDKVLRALFKGLNVHLVDAWEMTVAHHLKHDLHPPPPIIKNMINVVLSYICPTKSG